MNVQTVAIAIEVRGEHDLQRTTELLEGLGSDRVDWIVASTPTSSGDGDAHVVTVTTHGVTINELWNLVDPALEGNVRYERHQLTTDERLDTLGCSAPAMPDRGTEQRGT